MGASRSRALPYVLRALAALLAMAAWPAAAAAAGLLDVYRLAAERDPELAAARAAYRAALEARPAARATLLPNVGLGADISRTWLRRRGGVGSDAVYNNFRYTLSLNQPLYRRDRWIALRQADAVVAQAAARLEAAEQGLALRTAERYFAVLAARAELDYARSEKAAIAHQLAQARRRFEVGLVAVTDVREAEARHDQAVAAEIAARNALDSALEALAEITGEAHGRLADAPPDMPLARPDPEDMGAWVATAETRNPELEAARRALEIARQEVMRQRAGHLPTVDLVASYSLQDLNFGGIAPVDRFDTTVGVQLSLPLYAGGAVVSATRAAAEREAEARHRLELALRRTRRAVRDAYRGVLTAIGQVEALRRAVVSAETALEATEAGFEAGTRTIVDVLNAQRDLYRARRDFARARYDYLLNGLRLKRAAGTLAPEDVAAVAALLRE